LLDEMRVTSTEVTGKSQFFLFVLVEAAFCNSMPGGNTRPLYLRK